MNWGYFLTPLTLLSFLSFPLKAQTLSNGFSTASASPISDGWVYNLYSSPAPSPFDTSAAVYGASAGHDPNQRIWLNRYSITTPNGSIGSAMPNGKLLYIDFPYGIFIHVDKYISNQNIGNPQYFWIPPQTPFGPVRAPGSDESWVADPVNVQTGEFHLINTDLDPLGPLQINAGRLYSSRNAISNNLGYGWLTANTPFLVVSSDLTTINAADNQGGVFLYKRQGTTNTWLATAAENPEVVNIFDGRALVFTSSITLTTAGTDSIYKWTQPDGLVRHYKVRQFPVGSNTRERPYLEKITDNRGNEHIFTFGTVSTANDYGLINKITASNGASVTFVYDTGGRILTATANDGRVVTYGYTNGDLTSVQLPDGSTTAYVYDANHRIIRETKPDGRVLENTYDSLGRVITQKATVDPAQPGILITNATFDYSVPGQTTVKDAYNRATVYEYANGLITAIREPECRTTLKEWYTTTDTSVGAYQRSLKKVTDPRGLVTEYKYDAQGNVIETKITGDLDGDPATLETATTAASYNTLNQPLAVTDPRGITTTFAYDDSAYPYLPTQITTAKGATALRTDQLAYTARTGVDANNQPIFAKGLLATKTLAFGTADEAVTTYDYDATGFRVSETRATGTTDPAVVLTYTPTARREIATVTDAAGRVTVFTYDPMGRVLTKTVKDETGVTLGVWTTTYNANGEVARVDGPRTGPEDWIEHDYDQAGRPLEDRVYRAQAKADGTGLEAPAAPATYAKTSYTHDLFGNLVKTVDPLGNTTVFTYDGLGRLLSRKSYAGADTTAAPLRAESTTYEPGGQPATTTNALGGVTAFLYTATGKPRRAVSPDGSVHEWRYLADGRPAKEILRNGSFWETTYDDIARTVVRTLKKPDATVLASETRAYDRRGNLVSTTDAEGYTRTTAYDALDRVKTSTGPAAATGAAQQKTTATYDAAGKTLRTVNALGEATVTVSDALGRPVSVDIKDAQNATVRHTGYAYSADQWAVTVTTGTGPAALARTTYADPAGRPLLEIDGAGKFTRHAYDPAGNRLATTDPLARTTTWTYDALGQPLAQTLPDGNVTTFAYDPAGHLVTRTMAGGVTAETLYDPAGRPASSRLFNGATVSRQFSYAYYPATSPWAGLLQTTTTPRAAVTTAYDDFLRPSTITTDGPDPATDSTTTYAYDRRGLPTSFTQSSPANAAGPATSVTRAYDGYGHVLSETLAVDGAAHSSVAQTWDAAGRRVSLDETGAAPAAPLFTYAYRADGRLAQITAATTAATHTLAYAYADNGLLASRASPWRTLTINARDATGRITRQTTAVGSANAFVETMAYRDDGTLDSYGVTRNTPNAPDAWDENRGYSYNARGQVTGEGFSPAPATGDALAYVFDNNTAGLGIRTDAKVGTGAPAKWQSSATTINPLARVTADQTNARGRDLPANGVSLGADHVDLVVDGRPQGRAAHPGWADNVGAWTKTLHLGAGNHTLVATATHPSGHYTTSATSTFTLNVPVATLATAYDAEGNVVSRTWSDGTVQTLVWDAFNRLIKVSQRDGLNNGHDWTAVYDALGRRLRTTHQPVASGVPSGPPVVVASIYDPQAEFLEIGVVLNGAKAWKVYGPDLNGVYGALNGTGGLEAVVLDADGSATGAVGDAFGNVVAKVVGTTLTWSPCRVGGYGPLPDSAAEVLTDLARVLEAMAWRTRRIDPTGFYWLGARYYEPTTGRFLSPDPMGHASDPSLYAFANGDPVNRFDADGRFGKDLWGNPYRNKDSAFTVADMDLYIKQLDQDRRGWYNTVPLWEAWFFPNPYDRKQRDAQKLRADIIGSIGMYNLFVDKSERINPAEWNINDPLTKDILKFSHASSDIIITVATAGLAEVAALRRVAGPMVTAESRAFGAFKIGEKATGGGLPFTIDAVRAAAAKGGVGLEGINVELVQVDSRMFYGWANPNGVHMQLYPAAFESEESLIATLGHERTHLFQYKAYGPIQEVGVGGSPFEDAAIQIESTFLDYSKMHTP